MRQTILDAIVAERERQDTLWGEQNHTPVRWMCILTEEVGEACEAAMDLTAEDYRTELIQVAAVALAAIESLERNQRKQN